ncbi:hypothetical protein [Ammoniphilus sp. 3BR4]|uniref:hypothetical protein n=1 Tax=Ammoniphilus sp. 3BR4 TaxID=3158265 RepID=UPI003466021E
MGGVIEAEYIRLRTGEQYSHAVITSVDMTGKSIYTLGFIDEQSQHFICHVDNLSLIYQPKHKRICQLNNEAVKKVKTADKQKYLQRLLEVNEGSVNPIFMKEIVQILQEIGEKAFRMSATDWPVNSTSVLEKIKTA